MHDYYCILYQKQLNARLDDLKQSINKIKVLKDKTARQKAEEELKQVVDQIIKIEPHLAYLWCGASEEEEAANHIRDIWRGRATQTKATQNNFNLVPDTARVADLPSLSFLLRIPIRLRKPYLSKDERDFYLLDNPLRREKIFQTPMMASTGWKGALRAALWHLGYTEDNADIIRLFGNPRGSEEGQAGRLYFYPTFFDNVGLEVINPHNRATGVGARGPILLECVPPRSSGELVILYVPFGLQDEVATLGQVARDLKLVAEGVHAMLTIYGFGAKTSSGFGVANDELHNTGMLLLRADLPGLEETQPSAPAAQPVPDLPRYLESPTRLHSDFRQPDGSLKSEEDYKIGLESQGRQYGKKEKQLYDKAKKWWERKGRQLLEKSIQESKPESQPTPTPSQTPPVTKREFKRLSELVKVAQDLAAKLRGEVQA